MILYILLAAVVLGEFLILLLLGRLENCLEKLYTVGYYTLKELRRQGEDDEEDGPEDGPEPDELEEALMRATRGPVLPIIGSPEDSDGEELYRRWVV